MQLLFTVEASRRDHPEPPDGPKALDRVMQRAAQRLKQTRAVGIAKCTVNSGGDSRRGKRDANPSPSADEIAAFYAGLINSDKFLPASTISTSMRDVLLARSLVTAERLRERGVR